MPIIVLSMLLCRVINNVIALHFSQLCHIKENNVLNDLRGSLNFNNYIIEYGLGENCNSNKTKKIGIRYATTGVRIYSLLFSLELYGSVGLIKSIVVTEQFPN